jgi:hypothetical protein
MKPPIITVAPFGIIATASSAEMAFMAENSGLRAVGPAQAA